MSAHTGDVYLDLGGVNYTLRFDWRALSKVKTQYGDEAILRLLDQTPETIAGMLVCALERNHPEITLDKILDVSPPITPVLQAIDKALSYAYFGPDGPPDSSDSGVKQTNENP